MNPHFLWLIHMKVFRIGQWVQNLQKKKTKADENLGEYTLRRIVATATNLSSDLAYRNKIANEQNDLLANQTTLNLFEFAQKTNPSLASRYPDTYVELLCKKSYYEYNKG